MLQIDLTNLSINTIVTLPFTLKKKYVSQRELR